MVKANGEVALHHVNGVAVAGDYTVGVFAARVIASEGLVIPEVEAGRGYKGDFALGKRFARFDPGSGLMLQAREELKGPPLYFAQGFQSGHDHLLVRAGLRV